VVLMSASPEVYLGPLGRHMGVDAVLASGLEVGADGRLTGRLAGRNCRGAEKVAWPGTEPTDGTYLYAYGDSDGDRELLARADIRVLVRLRRPLSVLAAPHGDG
jgi:phosphatidylglycerophosphatase C